MQIFAGVRWGGGVKWEWCRLKWRFSLHSFTVFRTFFMATRQLSGDTTVNDLGHISRSLDCFTSNFPKTVCDMAKSYYRLLIGNHTLAFDWCHFWWPWSRPTFESHFSLGCHFRVHFSNPWHAFASHGLPAIAELLVRSGSRGGMRGMHPPTSPWRIFFLATKYRQSLAYLTQRPMNNSAVMRVGLYFGLPLSF